MMDTHRDFKDFQGIIDVLSATLRDGFKARDELVRGLWDALKDVDIEEVRANAKRIIATATRDTPFPKARDLRNSPPIIERTAADPKLDQAQRLNSETWRELKDRDPVRFQIELRIARAARNLADLDPRDPGFEDVSGEFHRWMSVRYAARAEQEATVAKYAGRTG